MNPILRHTSFLVVLASASLAAQQPAPRPTTASEAPTRDTSYIDADGTAHITRVDNFILVRSGAFCIGIDSNRC
jgi:hypothetical protein